MVEPLNTLAKGNRIWPRALRLVFPLLFFFAGLVPFAAAASSDERTSDSATQSSTPFTIADFDSDGRPDVARVQTGQGSAQNTSYWIDFLLTTGLRTRIGLTAPAGGLRLSTGDVNGDGYPDVIVTTFWANQPVAILLNDGRGNFAQSDLSAFPQAFTISNSGFSPEPGQIREGVVEASSRNLPGQCEQLERIGPKLIVIGRPLTSTFHFVGFFSVAPFPSRAPPYVIVQS